MTGLVTAVVVIGAATAIYQGEEQRKAAGEARSAQKQAQRQSLLRSVSQEKQAAQAERRANRKRPDVASLLFNERAQANTGVGSTILAGRGGGGTPLLGRKSSLMGI